MKKRKMTIKQKLELMEKIEQRNEQRRKEFKSKNCMPKVTSPKRKWKNC